MYEQYFGFSRTPFRLESEPDMFFFGESQKNVLACITTSLSLRKGIITLSGLPGSGKTTVMRRAIEDSILPDSIICRINRSRCGDFLSTLKQEIFVRQKKYQSNEYDQTGLRELVKNTLDEKKHYLIVVDESQQLTSQEVDELFLLASIEKDILKHFKFLLVSHEPFNECFDITKYPNYSQLVSNHCFLLPLLNSEILPYIEHRLSNTGWSGSPSFIPEIENIIFLITQGIPRRINSFFDRLMLFSYFESNKRIDLKFVKLFCNDLLVELEQLPHPDLDSFDLRQALRRENRLFSDMSSAESNKSIDRTLSHSESDIENKKTSSKLPLDEPLSSEDPVEILLFVSHFISNPERYKNYTDPYYKLPKNLTLLLCLATETNRYIDDITPEELSHFTAVDIKEMIAVFIEKMLISSRSNPSRILGLDDNASEDEVNRHFSYMMRLCRSEHLKTDSDVLCKKVKDAYIKLLSADVTIENEIPVIVDVLKVNEKSNSKIFDQLSISSRVQNKVDELEKNQNLFNEKTLKNTSTTLINNTTRNSSTELKRKIPKLGKKIIPASVVSVAVAAGLGYFFIGGEAVQKPDTKIEQLTLPIASKPEPLLNSNIDKKKIIAKKTTTNKVKKTDNKSKVVKSRSPVVVANRKAEKKVTARKKQPDRKKSTTANRAVSKPTKTIAQKQPNRKRLIENKINTPKNSKQNPFDENQGSETGETVATRNQSLERIANIDPSPNDIGLKSKLSSINTAGLNTFLIANPDNADDSKSEFDEQRFLENIELGRVISNFKFGYESGDIDELSTLFTESAVSNAGFNREQIMDDYELLFDESDSRTIKITNVKWTVEGDISIGTGDFTISIVDLDEVPQDEKEGKISFKVIEVDESKKITELFFLYQFVEAE